MPRPDNDNAGNAREPRPRPATGPRTPYPVEHPGIGNQPGTEPDYIPATPNDLPKI